MCYLAASSGDIRGEILLASFHKNSTAETDQNMLTLEMKQRDDVESRTSPLKRTSLQNPEQFRENETSSKPVMCLNYS